MEAKREQLETVRAVSLATSKAKAATAKEAAAKEEQANLDAEKTAADEAQDRPACMQSCCVDLGAC